MSSKKFSIEGYEKIKHKFGTIVYVSDQDITCEDALNLYKQKWEIELVNDFYKNTLELETVRRHDDYNVYGDEFLNMLTLIIGNRIKNKFADSKILGTKSYCDVMKIFKQYKKIQMPYKNDIWYETELPKKSMELIEKSCIVNFSGNFYKLKKAYSERIKFLSENQINNNQPDAVNTAQ